jgi:hypothetical protein
VVGGPRDAQAVCGENKRMAGQMHARLPHKEVWRGRNRLLYMQWIDENQGHEENAGSRYQSHCYYTTIHAKPSTAKTTMLPTRAHVRVLCLS